MKSTIKSLNTQLSAVTSTACQSQEICGVATMKTKYLGETGQNKIGACVPHSYCTDAAGCQIAHKFLPTGVSSQGCKVLKSLFLLCYLRKVWDQLDEKCSLKCLIVVPSSQKD